MSQCYPCKMFFYHFYFIFFKNLNWFDSKLFLSGLLRTYLCIVELVGAEAFMRFLSWRISQHHLHLHSIHRLAVQHRHGIICTLESQRNRGNRRPVQHQTQRQESTQLKRDERDSALFFFVTCLSAYLTYPTFLPGTRWISNREPKRLKTSRERKGYTSSPCDVLRFH